MGYGPWAAGSRGPCGWGNKRIGKVSKFKVVDGVVIGGMREIIGVGSGDGLVVKVVLVVIDGVVRAPLNDKTALLDERLAVTRGKGLNTCNDGVGNGQRSPAVAGNTSAGRKGHKVVGALSITRGIKSNRSQGASMRGVGGVMVVEDLSVAAKRKEHGGTIGTGRLGQSRLRWG